MLGSQPGCSGLFDDLDGLEYQGGEGELRVEILSGPASLTNVANAEFEFECDREVDCDFRCSLDGSSGEECFSPLRYDDLADGSHTFRVVAIGEDAEESEPEVWQWTVDTVEPIIEILDAPPVETSADWATVEFECTNKPSCNFQCALDYDDGSGSPQSGSWASCSSPHHVDGLDSGGYTLRIEAIDDAGNQAIETLTWVVNQWEMVSAGSNHTCGVRGDGTLWCWGNGNDGRLGLDDEQEEHHLLPEQVGTDTNWTAVSAGNRHTCGVRDDGTLWCWGFGWRGMLGLDDEDGRLSPEQVGSETDWAAISTGTFHTCGVRDDGTLWCWGRGSDGRLGLGDEEEEHRLLPEQVGSETEWASVSAGQGHTCGVRDNGTLWCWGLGGDGRLGLDDEENRLTPQRVGNDTDWTAVSTGQAYTCGVRHDGTLWCWGYGGDGQLGLDDEDGRLTPDQVGSDTDWTGVSTGLGHTCGVRDDGTLWCWGFGWSGPLGLGDEDGRLTPDQVGSETDWAAISAGAMHTCGVRAGTLWCWGLGGEGRLGLGDEEKRLTPEQVDDEVIN